MKCAQCPACEIDAEGKRRIAPNGARTRPFHDDIMSAGRWALRRSGGYPSRTVYRQVYHDTRPSCLTRSFRRLSHRKGDMLDWNGRNAVDSVHACRVMCRMPTCRAGARACPLSVPWFIGALLIVLVPIKSNGFIR